MSRKPTPPTPDVRDQRPKGRGHALAAEHYGALLAECRKAQRTSDHYLGLLAELRAELDAEAVRIADPMPVPITAADFLPRRRIVSGARSHDQREALDDINQRHAKGRS